MKNMAIINEDIGMKNRLTMSGGGKRIVCPFRRQEFWKFIDYVLLTVAYGKKGNNLWSEIPKYFGNKAPTTLQIYVRGNTNLYKGQL